MAANEPQVVSQFPLPPRQYIVPFAQHDAAPPAPPPPPQPESSYAMFGRVYATTDRLPGLAEAGRVCLYDDAAPPTAELRRLNGRLLALFYALLATLATPGAGHAPVVSRIEDVLINMHHLLNTLRPAQAAADLGGILGEQEEKRRAAAVQLAEASKLAEEEIAGAAKLLRAEAGEDADGVALEEAMKVFEARLGTHKVPAVGESGGDGKLRSKERKWYQPPGAAGGGGGGAGEAGGGKDAGEGLGPGFSADVLAEIERISNDPSL